MGLSLWPLAISAFGVALSDSAAAGLAAGFGLGMLTNLDLIQIVRWVQRRPERIGVPALGMVSALAVLWGGSKWVVGNLVSNVSDPGDFATHYWMGCMTVAAVGLVWTVIQFLAWGNEAG
jgi:hypothetical protein